MTKLTITDIRALPGTLSASEWRDRIYVNIKGNGARMAGEGNSKVWIDSAGKLNVEIGKGTISREWHANLASFKAAYAVAVEG